MGNDNLAFDEMLLADGSPREPYKKYFQWFEEQEPAHLQQKARDAENIFRKTGITFNVYGHGDSTEKLIPFDLIPRIISGREWRRLAQGIEQRVLAINAFLEDIYHKQEVIRAGRVPRELIERNSAYLPQMIGMKPPGGVYTHIVGTDIVRTGEDQFYVLEDNARTPSGVSYMLEDRETMMQMFPELFQKVRVRPVEDYPTKLRQSLDALAPPGCKGKPRVAVLTPGIFNSAFYEHAFLADQMGAELVEGSDLRVINGKVCMRTTLGYEPVDVLYRRVDDDFLDPEVFREDSMLGVPGLMRAYRAGRVALVNAPGTGVADDKVVYGYLPRIIEYYMGEKAILANVPTYMCWNETDREHVLDNLDSLVVKAANESGGYGMLIGPHSTEAERSEFAVRIRENPRNYIAQPTLALSRSPVVVDGQLEGRHVDLRPFILYGRDVYVLPGGLTRVALRKGSLVVNSSQGGGSKDTWVLDAPSRS
jgi:uncharacterized circularly permuted ATP-grasp superfamily protein